MAHAATLEDLNFSDVIQITPTDTTMLNCSAGTAGCSTTTSTVLPFKFVKMRARESDGSVINKAGYSYFMFLDNYCWWGKAQCHYNGNTASNIYPNYQAYNGVSGTGNYSNNITTTLSPNILDTLANFYDSLPSTIGGVDKNTAIPTHDFDFMPMSYSQSTAPTPAWGSTSGSWPTTDTVYNPSSNSDSAFTFLGTTSNSNPRTRSRISLISYTEWQGALTGYANYTSQSTTNGSGGSFCFARFGNSSCTSSSGATFDDANTSVSNVNGGNLVSSSSNPRPRYPWTRSAYASSASGAFSVYGNTGYSLYYYSANGSIGVSPVLWLDSSLKTASGEGTYSSPYILQDIDCDDPANANKLGCYSLGTVIQMTGQNSNVTYKFIKFSDNTYNNNLADANLWMLGDNYCELHSGKSSSCVNNGGVAQTYYQTWNPTSDGTRYNNWTTMMSTTNSVWNKVLSPLYDDLPSTIGDVVKDTAVKSYAYDMYSVTAISGTGSTTASNCYLTTGTNIDTGSCTHTAKISLPSYQEWQNGLYGQGYYAPSGTPAAEYQKARFSGQYGANGNYGLFANWYPWLRTAVASSAGSAFAVYGNTSGSLNYYSAGDYGGVSPVLWLSSDLEIGCGAGIYVNPYRLGDDPCNTTPTITITTPSATPWINASTMTVAGTITDPDEDNWTVYYNVSSSTTAGSTWNVLRSSSTSKSFSTSISHGQASSANTLYVHVKVNDGTEDSTSTYATFKVDTIAPTCNTSSWNPSEATWKNTLQGTTFSISCTDTGGSGLDPLVVTPTCTTGTTNGSTCPIQIYDGASNVSLSYTSPVNKVDMDIPTGSITTTGGESTGSEATSDLIYQVSPSISYIPTDGEVVGVNASGIDSVKSAWILDVDTNTTQSCEQALSQITFGARTAITDIEIPRNGTHTFCTQAKDIAGNLSQISSQTFTLDTSIPTVSGEITGSPTIVNTWYTQVPTFEITASDNNGSGLAGIYYRIIEASIAGTLPSDYDVTSDASATFVAVGSSGQLTQTQQVPFTNYEGSYYIYYAAKDATVGIEPSETLRENIKIDLTSPVSVIESVEFSESGESVAEVPLSSDDVNYVLYQNTNQVSASDTISSQAFIDLNANGGTDALTVNLDMFDPLSSDLTQAAPIGMSSGINTCLLEVRSANILTDGSGKIESTFDEILNQVQDDGEAGQDDNEMIEVIDFTPWTTLSTTCNDSYNLVPQASTLYQLRLSATDVAGHQGDVYTSQTAIYNLSKIYTPDFVEIDGNVLSADLASNIYTIDCTTGTCIPDHFDITGSLSSTTQATEYELCLAINGVSTPKCTTVITSTSQNTNYSLLFTVADFPSDTDVFPGGTLTIIDTASHNSITKQANIVFQIKRARPELVPTVQMREYVHMIDSRLN